MAKIRERYESNVLVHLSLIHVLCQEMADFNVLILLFIHYNIMLHFEVADLLVLFNFSGHGRAC